MIKVTVGELYVAMPVLRKIYKARLPSFGVQKVTALLEAVETNLAKATEIRITKLKETTILDEAGNIATEEVTVDGKLTQQPVFKSVEAKNQYETFFEALKEQTAELPLRLKMKYFEPMMDKPDSGYLLTPEECILLGKLLYREPIPEETE